MEMYVELITRISIAEHRPGEGILREAPTSLYSPVRHDPRHPLQIWARHRPRERQREPLLRPHMRTSTRLGPWITRTPTGRRPFLKARKQESVVQIAASTVTPAAVGAAGAVVGGLVTAFASRAVEAMRLRASLVEKAEGRKLESIERFLLAVNAWLDWLL